MITPRSRQELAFYRLQMQSVNTKGDLAVALVLLPGRCFSAGLSHSPDYEHPLVLPQLRHL